MRFIEVHIHISLQRSVFLRVTSGHGFGVCGGWATGRIRGIGSHPGDFATVDKRRHGAWTEGIGIGCMYCKLEFFETRFHMAADGDD
jgi:hypothetical protein